MPKPAPRVLDSYSSTEKPKMGRLFGFDDSVEIWSPSFSAKMRQQTGKSWQLGSAFRCTVNNMSRDHEVKEVACLLVGGGGHQPGSASSKA